MPPGESRGLVLRFQKPAGLREKFFAGKQDVERLQQRVCAHVRGQAERL